MSRISPAPSRLGEGEITWTSRQREVLDLLVRGRTNVQIAEALEISLDGAKWHVTEIISKLGVNSREEAAEYWRAHNGLRLRFSRAFRGLLLSSPWLKVGGGLAVAIAASAAIIVWAAVLNRSGSNGPGAIATPPSSPSPTPAESTPTPAPTFTASPAGAATPTIGVVTVPGVLPSLTPIPLPNGADLSAPSSSVVWAIVGGSNLFRSIDSGITWTHEPTPGGANPFSGGELSFVDETHGWLLSAASPATQCQAESFQLWRTSDAGANWQSLSTTNVSGVPTAPGISANQCKEGLSFVDANHGFVAAYDPNHQPVIYRTSDGGGSWTASAPLPDPPGQQTTPGGFSLRPGQVAKRGNVLLVDAVGFQHLYVYQSTDGGATWSYVSTVPNTVDVGNVAYQDATHWWAVSEGPGQLVTADAGKTWQAAPGNLQFAAPIPPVLTFAGAQVGYATVRGEIDRTTDGGQSWQRIQTPGTQQVP